MVIDYSNMYDIDKHLPEIYDQAENKKDDIEFLLNILQDMKSPEPRILEPFCGTGRILIPLAQKGYKVVGMDIAAEMLNHLKDKLEKLDGSLHNNIELIEANILEISWPRKFDLVILGCNCMYELPTSEEQKEVIEKAYKSLKSDGLIFIDNDNMEGVLDESWCNIGVEEKIFPSGECSHGVKMQGFSEPIWVDREKRLWKAKRRIEIEFPDGKQEEISYIQQKHPVSADEINRWLKEFGFEILGIYAGTKNKKKFVKRSKRATFVAKKR